MTRTIRGSAVKLTYPYVLRYLGLWLVVTTLVVLVFTATSYLLLADRLAGAELRRFAIILFAQTAAVILALVALALFTTHRLAGPFIAVKRACDDVRNGDLSRRLRFRSAEARLLRDVEEAFNGMVESLEARAHGEATPPAALREAGG